MVWYEIELGRRGLDQERELIGFLRENQANIRWITSHKIAVTDPEVATYLKLAYGQ